MTSWLLDTTPGQDLDAAPTRWGRRRLLAALALVAVSALALVAGLGYGLYVAVTDHPGTGAAPSPHARIDVDLPASGPARRDAIAAQPMLTVPPDAARPTTPTGRPLEPVVVPAASGVGPADVLAGYPHTSEGALGQLAAITQAVLQALDPARASVIHDAWSQPGAVPATEWEPVLNVGSFLAGAARAGVTPDAAGLSTVTATPVGGQVKGADGPDWVLACVLMEISATSVRSATIAHGYCDRMTWTPTSDPAGGRWVIAAGDAPAPAPATWPGTDLAARAGWLPWRTPTRPATSGPGQDPPAAGDPPTAGGAARPLPDRR